MGRENMRKFKHLLCNEGRVNNPFFEACRDYDVDPGDCASCQWIHPNRYSRCVIGETIPCEECQGKGYIELSEIEWEEVDV